MDFTRPAIHLTLALALLTARAASAQVDVAGEWGTRYHEDYWHRQAGPEVGDYLGLPINDAARLKADSWRESVLTEPERQCIPHVATYFMRGPANLRISKVLDPVTEQPIAYKVVGMFGRADRMIWLDGRPHPSTFARHTWAGFSTGKWEGNQLAVTTTHIKMGWIQRNGVPASPSATMSEHFIRHDNYLTLVSVVTDPAYLDEPLIRTTNWVLDYGLNIVPYPCGPAQISDEAGERAKNDVPHHLPGANTQLQEFADKNELPLETTRGGADQMYPDYVAKLGALIAERPAATAANAPRNADDPFIGRWRLNRGKSTFSANQPERRTILFEPVGDAIHLVTDTVPIANDSGANRVEYTFKYDGVSYPVVGSALERVAVTRIDRRSLQRARSLKGQLLQTDTLAVTPDGNVLTINTKGNFDGRAFSSTQVFERY